MSHILQNIPSYSLKRSSKSDFIIFPHPPPLGILITHTQSQEKPSISLRKIVLTSRFIFDDVLMSHIFQNTPSYSLKRSSKSDFKFFPHLPPLGIQITHKQSQEKTIHFLQRNCFDLSIHIFLCYLLVVFHMIETCGCTAPSFDSAI